VLTISSEPEAVFTLRMRGENLMRQGNFIQAIQVFQEALRHGGEATLIEPLIRQCKERIRK